MLTETSEVPQGNWASCVCWGEEHNAAHLTREKTVQMVSVLMNNFPYSFNETAEVLCMFSLSLWLVFLGVLFYISYTLFSGPGLAWKTLRH